MHEITLEHTTDTGHRIVGHQGKCARIHGHSYRWLVNVKAEALNDLGFVADFADIKDILNEWDHRLVLWEKDPAVVTQPGQAVLQAGEPVTDEQLKELRRVWEEPYRGGETMVLPQGATFTPIEPDDLGVVRVAFNPTAENMAADRAKAIWEKIGPSSVSVQVWETAKCSALAVYEGTS